MKTKNHIIKWRHILTPPDQPFKKEQRSTEVVITTHDGTQVSSATVTCFHKDTYSKEEGRRRSLEKALEGFSKEERTEIWAAYTASKKSPSGLLKITFEEAGNVVTIMVDNLPKKQGGTLLSFSEKGVTAPEDCKLATKVAALTLKMLQAVD